MSKIRTIARDISQGLKNLARWLPVIWKDRDWDHFYIYELMRAKLENQAEYIGSNDRHTSAKRDSERMMLAARLIRRLQDEHYGDEYLLCSESGIYDEYFAKYPRVCRAVRGGQISHLRKGAKTNDQIALEISLENHERCRRLLFRIMEKNIERWWD